VPLAAVAFVMVAAALPEHEKGKTTKFDKFGFVSLALGLIALQLLLDRGPRQEWFASPEIWIELGLAALGFYLFFVHTFTSAQAIFDRRIWLDRNFLAASIMMAFIGMLMFAGMAVLPTLLQSLLGYPVLHSGLVQLPRGVGTLTSMFVVGRLLGRIDSRLIVLGGLALTGWSYVEMSHFSLQMDERLVLVSGLLQGLGLGLIFVPMSALAFTTITPQLRIQAASLFTLVRNVGSSIGISMVGALQIFNTRIVQSQLVEHVTPDNQIAASMIDLGNLRSLAALSQVIARQSAMVAYIDSFHLLFWMCVVIAPLVLLMRTKKRGTFANV
jgi:DHA2 family multidrug resistance protein